MPKLPEHGGDGRNCGPYCGRMSRHPGRHSFIAPDGLEASRNFTAASELYAY